MVKQFDAYVPVENVHINGKLTLGENLADLGGLWIAYLAWTQDAEKAHVDMTSKEEGYTPPNVSWLPTHSSGVRKNGLSLYARVCRQIPMRRMNIEPTEYSLTCPNLRRHSDASRVSQWWPIPSAASGSSSAANGRVQRKRRSPRATPFFSVRDFYFPITFASVSPINAGDATT